MKRRGLLLTAGLAAAALALTSGLAMAGGAAKVDTATSAEYGTYLVNKRGMSLYLFEPDDQGRSTCYDACAQAWPPVTTEGQPKATGNTDPSLLGAFKRQDGSRQVTYNGWPLYTFVKDTAPGDTAGQDVRGFGGEWYLVAPEGEHVEDH